MTTYFCWIKNRLGIVEPQVYYNMVPVVGPHASGFTILRTYPLPADYDDELSLDQLAERYPYEDASSR